jgi:predicted metal-dependent hydrolase
MTEPLQAEDRALLARGIALFNDGEYFVCHEVWEELWKRSTGDARPALQGLIQATVALLHAERGNRRGAMSVYQKALGNLAKAPGDCMGLKLADLALALSEFFDEISEGKSFSKRPQIKVDFA